MKSSKTQGMVGLAGINIPCCVSLHFSTLDLCPIAKAAEGSYDYSDHLSVQ